ncbi:DUF397 domain-containing protein [Kitasatospora sp. NPDC058444]|uniref:DUF397 domain-containing protein n=1 Tax=Kitasatospora sp. NPDC058444 TaxID=3346504 RepID=UPI0036628FB2
MPDSTWQKSSYSAANNEYMEVRTATGTVELRDSDDGVPAVTVAQGEPVRLLVVGQVSVHRGERPTASRPGARARGRLLVSVRRDLACSG